MSTTSSGSHHIELPPRPGNPALSQLRLDTNDLSLRPATPSNTNVSPGGYSAKIRMPKKQYSREDSLERMETPAFDKTARVQRKGPSSAGTVLTMAGLFVVGLTLMLSGIIVVIQQTETPFIITGCIFIGVGFSMIFVCAILQRKNVVKFVVDMNRDLYFLGMSDTLMWKLMFEMRSELPLSHDS